MTLLECSSYTVTLYHVNPLDSEQFQSYGCLVTKNCNEQSRKSTLVDVVDVGPCIHQRPYHVRVAGVRRDTECGSAGHTAAKGQMSVAKLVRLVHIDAVRNEFAHTGHIAGPCSGDDRRLRRRLYRDRRRTRSKAQWERV